MGYLLKGGLIAVTLLVLALNMKAQLHSQPPEIKSDVVSFPDGSIAKEQVITYKLIPASNSTWCYDIYLSGKLFIHQPSIPGYQGNEGFKTKEKASVVAEFVIQKIIKGQMPPSVTLEELKQLNAL